jgi:hypothetical protein
MRLFLLTMIAVSLIACGPSTEIVKSWQEPNASLNVADSANKVLVISMVKDEGSRRVIEDQVVKRLKGTAVPSYTLLNTDVLKEASGEKLTQILQQEKFTHVILMRLADIEKETSYVPGTTSYYGGYGRYYAYGAGAYSNAGYYTTDKNYFIETTVYSVEPDKLLWTGTTKSVNPTKIEKTVNEIADVLSEKMKKDKFIK